MPSTRFAQAHGDVVRSAPERDAAGAPRSRSAWFLGLLCALAVAAGLAGYPEQRAALWLAAGLCLLLSDRHGPSGPLAWASGIGGMLGWGAWQGRTGQYALAADLDLLLAVFAACLALAARQRGEVRRERDARRQRAEDEHRKGLLDALLAGNQDCLALLDRDARVRALNRSGLDQLELQAEGGSELPSWLHWWPISERAAAERRWRSALDGEPQHFSADCPTFRGSPRSWDIQLLPVADPQGGVSSVLSLWRDITPLQRSLEEARATRDAHAALLERIDDAFVALDTQWRIVYANAEAQAILDVGRGDGSRTLWDCFPELLGSEFHAQCIDSLALQESRRFQHFLARHQIWFNVAIYPSAEGAALLIRDVTEQVRSEVLAERHRARLALAQEIAGFGDWEYDVLSGVMELGEASARLLHCDTQGGEGQRRLLSVIEPAQRADVLAHLLGQISAREPIDVRFNVSVDGAQRVIRMRGRFVADEAGQLRHVVGTLHDMTEAARSLETLSRERAFTRGILDTLPQHICVLDSELTLVATNRAWDDFAADHSPDPPKLCVGASYRAACLGSSDPAGHEVLAGLQSVLDGRQSSFRYSYLLATGGEDAEARWFEVNAAAFESAQGRLLVVCHEDVSTRQATMLRIAAVETKFRELAECMPDAAFILDPLDGRFSYLGPNWRRLPVALDGKPPEGLDSLLPALAAEDAVVLRDLLASDGWFESGGQLSLNLACPEAAAIELRWSPVREPGGRVVRVVGVLADVSERVRHAARLRQVAYEDAVTGLPNSMALNELLADLTAADESTAIDLLLIDIDRLKGVNDALGRAAGDELLRQVAARLLQVGDANTSLARLAGDEFALVQRNAVEPLASLLASEVMECLHAPLQVAGESVPISVGIGAARFPQDAADAAALLRCADLALSAAKRRGSGVFHCHDGRGDQGDPEQLRIRGDLRQALQRREFRLVYQPKHAVADGRLLGFEALLRWDRGGVEPVSPLRFVPLLEESGDIVEVGSWVLNEACRQLRCWREAGAHDLKMAVNVSARQLGDARIVSEVVAALVEHDLPGAALELEITESAFLTDPQLAERFVADLRQHGIRVALDDFGTGFSSLSYLRRLAPDMLKIDKSFIDDVGLDAAADKVVQGIVQLAHGLAIRVVAEGVESEAQRRQLCAFGCDELQGFLFAPPRPPDALTVPGAEPALGEGVA